MALRKRVFANKHSRPRKEASEQVRPVAIRRFTGYDSGKWKGIIPRLRTGRYKLDNRSVGGDAPKDFILVYDYEGPPVQRDRTDTWPAYVAKVGHQYYPAESATEQLMTRIGQLCGVRMADSRLMVCAGQLRFLSRYFLGADEILNHAAEILGRHLADQAFVDGVAEDRIEKEIFTFQVYSAAIRSIFPKQFESILRDFVRMIGFDALVGNQDRHFYNWGVITHTRAALTPRFAPIYDTARGLFWNTTEERLVKLAGNDVLKRYVENSTPQIGWDGHRGRLNHFDLVQRIADIDARCRVWLQELADSAISHLDECKGTVDAEFDCLLSEPRRNLIKRCLELRFENFCRCL
jgi:hypothetical protein